MSQEDQSTDGSAKRIRPVFSGPSPPESVEHRTGELGGRVTDLKGQDPTVPSVMFPTKSSPPNIFQQVNVTSHLTPESAGIDVKESPGNQSERKEVDVYEHTVGGQSEKWWNEQRDKREGTKKSKDAVADE